MPRRRVFQPLPNASHQQETRLREAMEAVATGYCRGPADAAKAFSVPRTTLYRRIKNSAMEQRGGYNRKLEKEQEIAVCNWLDRSIRHGFPPRLDHVQHVAQRVLDACRDPTTPAVQLGQHWARRFVERHPKYNMRMSKPLDVQRHARHNAPEISAWYREFEAVRKELGVLDKDTWNMDESGFFCGVTKSSYVVIERGMKRAFVNNPLNRDWITSVEAISADGRVLPPLLIMAGKVHLQGWYQQQLPGDYRIGVTDNGYVNNEFGLQWLRFFDKLTYTDLPRLLLLDGHDSHISVDFIDYCHDHNIWPLCLPPHTTHLMQPLDVVVFQPYKHHLGRAVDKSTRAYISVS